MEKPGILLIDKPLGVRSTSCVSFVKRLVGRKVKVGHAGTLDSTAQGLLLILLGKATRLSRYIMSFPKSYVMTVEFGKTTETDDASGKVLFSAPLPSTKTLEKKIDTLLPSFLGARMQRPPNISAVHVSGKRAHAVTRSGETPDICEKLVSIYRISRTSSVSSSGRASFSVSCSKGTYMRSIARDLGHFLGTGAHVVSLKRTGVGRWTCEEALPFALLEEKYQSSELPLRENIFSLCHSPLEAAEHFSLYSCAPEYFPRVNNGNALAFDLLQRLSWGGLSCGEGMVVHTSDSLVFGVLDVFSFEKAFFVPKSRIFLGEA